MKNTVTRALRFIAREINTVGLDQRLQDNAWDEAVEFIEENDHVGCDFHTSSASIRRAALNHAPKHGLMLEFGVNRGKSTNLFSNLLRESSDHRKLYGFDNFSGLTEDWTGMGRENGHVVRKKYFDLKGRPPHVTDNVELVIGDIEETLVPFLEEHQDEPIAFIHIDTDTYTPCRLVLNYCKSRLQNGTIILFDQLIGYPGYRFHEFAALQETLDRNEYVFVGFGIAQERSNLVKASIRYSKD